MKALVGAFNQEKALVGAFSVIVQPVVEPMDSFTALFQTLSADNAISAAAVSPEDGLVVEVEAPHQPSLQVNTRS